MLIEWSGYTFDNGYGIISEVLVRTSCGITVDEYWGSDSLERACSAIDAIVAQLQAVWGLPMVWSGERDDGCYIDEDGVHLYAATAAIKCNARVVMRHVDVLYPRTDRVWRAFAKKLGFDGDCETMAQGLRALCNGGGE